MADLALVLKKLAEGKEMPATQFICPNGDKVNINECLTKCKQGKRCMFLPTLRAIAKSVDRKVKQPSVTELISGVRETYLKKATEYAVDLFSILYSLQGQAVHSIHEKNSEGMLSEIRMEDGITSGKFVVKNSFCVTKSFQLDFSRYKKYNAKKFLKNC